MRIGNYENRSHVFKNFGTANSSSWERNVQLFFLTQYKHNVTLQDFADSLCLSPRQASRLIKQNHGVSFLENLFKVRVQYAKIMIETTDKSLDEIQSSCGFKNYKSFLTNFRKYTGKSPAAYKLLIEKEKRSNNEH
jgi:two-component system response regulator YesN